MAMCHWSETSNNQMEQYLARWVGLPNWMFPINKTQAVMIGRRIKQDQPARDLILGRLTWKKHIEETVTEANGINQINTII